MVHDKIAVVDFDGFHAHLIATQIRRFHVLSEILDPSTPPSALGAYRGIILSGCFPTPGQPVNPAWLALPLPILGLGPAQTERGKSHQRRSLALRFTSDCTLTGHLPHEMAVDIDVPPLALPEGFREIGVIIQPDGTMRHNAAIAHQSHKHYGLPLFPGDGPRDDSLWLENFVLRICGCQPTWTIEQVLEEQIATIRQNVGDRGVFLLVSGGVDSTVCASLLGKALGPDRIHLLHIDNGMMRKNESSHVIAEFKRLGLARHLHIVDASDRFLSNLAGVIEPEKKRLIIGNTYLEVFEAEAERLQLSDMLLGQGTIYPDTVETGSSGAPAVKTHHNRVPLVEKMIAQGRVIEPIRDLYKVEVRELGERLGVDPSLVWRHPFPGPGLGVRTLCSDGTLPQGHEQARWQPLIDAQTGPVGMHGLLMPIRSVGMTDHERTYEQPVFLWGKATEEKIIRLSENVFRQIPGINRCVVDLTGKGASRMQPLAASLTRQRLDLLREADEIVMKGLAHHGLERAIWQCPTVLLPLSIDGKGQELVVVRPVYSERAMTARPAWLPEPLVSELLAEILALPGVSGLALDVTPKPPGTIEWE